MKKLLLISIIVFHTIILIKRLPDWNNDKSIWVSAIDVEPLDPWVLNNAAHLSHDENAKKWLIKFLILEIPNWLPYNEREPYRIGLEGLRDSLRINNFKIQSDEVNNKINEVMIGHKIIVNYETK